MHSNLPPCVALVARTLRNTMSLIVTLEPRVRRVVCEVETAGVLLLLLMLFLTMMWSLSPSPPKVGSTGVDCPFWSMPRAYRYGEWTTMSSKDTFLHDPVWFSLNLMWQPYAVPIAVQLRKVMFLKSAPHDVPTTSPLPCTRTIKADCVSLRYGEQCLLALD